MAVVKREEAEEIGARFAQFHGTPHQRHNVRGSNHLLDGFFRDARHGAEGAERGGDTQCIGEPLEVRPFVESPPVN